MKERYRYLTIVEWSDEDQGYIGFPGSTQARTAILIFV